MNIYLLYVCLYILYISILWQLYLLSLLVAHSVALWFMVLSNISKMDELQNLSCTDHPFVQTFTPPFWLLWTSASPNVAQRRAEAKELDEGNERVLVMQQRPEETELQTRSTTASLCSWAKRMMSNETKLFLYWNQAKYVHSGSSRLISRRLAVQIPTPTCAYCRVLGQGTLPNFPPLSAYTGVRVGNWFFTVKCL